jgi:two-component system sensor kinase FixL
MQHTENILLVDDNPVNNQLIATYLLPCGYTIQIAENGRDGLRLAKENKPDLILLDIMMPDMDGYEVCRLLRDNPVTADIPILFITADASPENHLRAFSIGGNDFITKPIYEMVLLARIDNLIKLYNSQKRVEKLNKYYELSQKISLTGYWSYKKLSGKESLFHCSQQLRNLLHLQDDQIALLTPENFLSLFIENCNDRERVSKSWIKAELEGCDFKELINCRICGEKKNIRLWAQFSEVNEVSSAFGSVQDVTGLMGIIYEEFRLANKLAYTDRYNSMVESGTQLAHELNQPLASIALNVNATKLFLENDSFDKEEFFEIIKDVESEVMRAKEVVERMRSVANRKPLQVEEFDIHDLIKRTSAIFTQDFNANNITLVENYTGDLCLISGDKDAVQQVMVNIIRNAYESLRESVQDRKTIVLSLLESSGMVSFSVVDNGPGISGVIKDTLFFPLVTTKSDNLGLGLVKVL